MTPRLSSAEPGVVVLSRTDQPQSPDPQARVNIVATRKTVKYGVRDDGRIYLTASTANHYRGATRWGGSKAFSRWATDTVEHIAARPGEPWRVSTFTTGGRGRRAGWTRGVIFAETLGRTPLALRDRAGDLLPAPPSLWGHYPLLSHYLAFEDVVRITGPWGDWASAWAPAEVRRAFVGTTSAADLTRRLFGKTRYRRDLVKAVASTSLPALSFAWQFRGLVPVDWLIEFMRNHRDARGRFLPHVRPHLRVLDIESRRSLLREHGWPQHRLLADITRYRVADNLGRVHTWRELHDDLVNHTLTFRTALTKSGKPKRPVRLPDYAKALTGELPSGLTIEVARHENELWEWGIEMRHCIGGYSRELRSGRGILGAVRAPGGRMLANFEVKVSPVYDADTDSYGDPSLTLNQLLGRANALLPDAVRVPVVDHLAAHGIEIPDDYWGTRVVPGLVEAA